MDPYIEDPEVWSDFHGGLAEEISASLNQFNQPRYVARMTPRVTYELVEIAENRGTRPDVGIRRQTETPVPGIAAARVITPPAAFSTVAIELPLRLFSVEIREVGTLRLVTAIEILSPVNKRPGHEAFDEYNRKRRELFRSAANLIEIDLLRAGTRPPLERAVPDAPYYVTLSRESERPRVDVWPIQLQDHLPVLPVPLLEPDPDAILGLGAVVARVYERGGYGTLIDYRADPPPPKLAASEVEFVNLLLGPIRKNE